MFRFLAGLLIPGGVLVAAAAALQREEIVLAAAAPYATYYCVGALITALFLSWYYDQSRLLGAAAVVTLAMLAIDRWPGAGHAATVTAISLLPLNFAIVALVKERGVMTLPGLGLLGLVAAQAAGVWWIGEHPNVWPAPGWLVPMSSGFGAIALASLVLERRTKVEQGLLWAFVAVLLGVNQTSATMTAVYAGTAGLVLVFAVLEHGFDIAYRDELTGLPSRRAFSHAKGRLGTTYAIAICDVDHFKQFNDRYGHESGNQVLRGVAAKLAEVGGGGRAFRYGGEEFLLVFKGRSAREAEPFVEAVRRAIEASPLRPSRPGSPDGTEAEETRVSISVGIAERSARYSTADQVLAAADAALYAAKAAGRNRTHLADDLKRAG